jgi:SpoVK/Ycf46/Vps4 family AAA+-type ATPase
MLCGKNRQDIRNIAAASCGILHRKLLSLHSTLIPSAQSERSLMLTLINREILLGNTAILFEYDNDDNRHTMRNTISFIEKIDSDVMVSAEEPLRFVGRPAIRIDIERPSASEQLAIWKNLLSSQAINIDGEIESIVSQFDMTASDIATAGTDAIHRIVSSNGTDNMERRDIGAMIWEACRNEARPRLEDLAQRIVPSATWDEFVLPEQQNKILLEMISHVKQRGKVYYHWGFAGKNSRGLGISALFSGPSGTGKTMASELIAKELNLDLFRIDLSSTISKYIGETEKNLKRIFDAAEGGGAILLFDEADALFGKRTEVKDSHDRYANMEVSYLLQRIEAYRGLAILTTNMKETLDNAFLRRIRFVVNFPFPKESQRETIWKNIFPDNAPVNGIDMQKLARLNITGGNIRNIALNAAFLAAEDGVPIGMSHALEATRSEYAKLEKPLSESEIEGWV